MMYRLRAALQGFCRRLSRFMARHFIDRESEWADAEELGRLGQYVDGLLEKIARELGQGFIDADPCYTSEDDNACTYCPFAAACGFTDGEGGDRSRPMRPVGRDEFFTDIKVLTGGKA